MNVRGQALVEFSLFFMSISILMVGVIAFTQWMQTRQKLLLASKEAALLFSSGRFKTHEVDQLVRNYLKSGAPPIDPEGIQVEIRQEGGLDGSYYQLDRVVVRYFPTHGWPRILNFNEPMEEICIVRHAPIYGPPWMPWVGPPVKRSSAHS